MKKYEFTGKTKKAYGVTLHQIRALKYFGEVKAGDLGGWIEKESNLSHDGNAWVADNACVYNFANVRDNACVKGESQVFGKAQVYGNAIVYDKAHVFDRAEVCGNAVIVHTANICGCVKVCNDSRIYGNAWIIDNAPLQNPCNANSGTMNDNVNHPTHYTSGKFETIDVIQDKLTPEMFEGFCVGNVIKYVTRYKLKNGVEDLKKARWYLDKVINFMQSDDFIKIPKAVFEEISSSSKNSAEALKKLSELIKSIGGDNESKS